MPFPFLTLRISEYIAKACRSCDIHPASKPRRSHLLSPVEGRNNNVANTTANTIARINRNLQSFSLSIQIPIYRSKVTDYTRHLNEPFLAAMLDRTFFMVQLIGFQAFIICILPEYCVNSGKTRWKNYGKQPKTRWKNYDDCLKSRLKKCIFVPG